MTCPTCGQTMPQHKHESDGQIIATTIYQDGRTVEKTRCKFCPKTLTRTVKGKRK